MTNNPPIQDRPDDTEGDDAEECGVPADLLELHEVLEYQEAVAWAQQGASA